jgi:hypothetical protein
MVHQTTDFNSRIFPLKKPLFSVEFGGISTHESARRCTVLHGGAPTIESCTKQTWVKITPGPSHHLGCDTTMAKKKKLFAGVGAKCTVLTKFV